MAIIDNQMLWRQFVVAIDSFGAARLREDEPDQSVTAVGLDKVRHFDKLLIRYISKLLGHVRVRGTQR